MAQMRKVIKEGLNIQHEIRAGPGIPRAVLEKMALEKAKAAKLREEIEQGSAASTKLDFLFNDHFRTFLEKDSRKEKFSEITDTLNLEEFDFPEEQGDVKGVHMDVTALDRYNEDVRKHRKNLLEECRLLPHKGSVDIKLLERIRHNAESLCRACHYGTHKAQNLGRSSVIVLTWLMNRTNLPVIFHVKILQSVTEMLWTSEPLKLAFSEAHGMPVLARLMKAGLLHSPPLACWACMACLAAAIGCGEAIESAQDFPQMAEIVSEMAFFYFWKDWPANFGMILQGVLFGPHSVVPSQADEGDFGFM